MYKLEISPQAAIELIEARNWYEHTRKGLGKRLSIEYFETLKQVQKRPFHYQVRFNEDFRFANLKKYPYTIVYEVIEDTIIVYSFFHTSRNPKDL